MTQSGHRPLPEHAQKLLRSWCPSLGGKEHEAAGIHQVTRRRDGGLAVYSTCTASSEAGDRVLERPLPRRYWAGIAGVSQRSGRSRLFDGQNVTIEYRWARGEYGRLPAFAAEFVQRRVNVLVATGGNASALAAKHATATIPIVFVAGDPVRHGLVHWSASFCSESQQRRRIKRSVRPSPPAGDRRLARCRRSIL